MQLEFAREIEEWESADRSSVFCTGFRGRATVLTSSIYEVSSWTVHAGVFGSADTYGDNLGDLPTGRFVTLAFSTGPLFDGVTVFPFLAFELDAMTLMHYGWFVRVIVSVGKASDSSSNSRFNSSTKDNLCVQA